MRIRMLTSRVTNEGHTQCPGDVIDVPDAEALRMINGGLAQRVGHEPETAMLEQAYRGGKQSRATRGAR